MNPNAEEVIIALKAKNGKEPEVVYVSTEDARAQAKVVLDTSTEVFPLFAAMWKSKLAIGTATVGEDIYEVKAWPKKKFADFL